MSVLSQAAIVRAGHALNELSEAQRRAITGLWVNPGYDRELVPAIDPKLVALALAVIDYYSDATAAELDALREPPQAMKDALDRAKHEIEALHNHVELLNAKNNVLRKSLDESSQRSREVDTDFAVLRSSLITQF